MYNINNLLCKVKLYIQFNPFSAQKVQNEIKKSEFYSINNEI